MNLLDKLKNVERKEKPLFLLYIKILNKLNIIYKYKNQ